MSLPAILDRHGLTQLQVSQESGIPISTINGVFHGTRQPRTDTVNRLLAYLRRYEPALTYEQVWGEPASTPTPEENCA
jgi:predicted transcriptional regulator